MKPGTLIMLEWVDIQIDSTGNPVDAGLRTITMPCYFSGFKTCSKTGIELLVAEVTTEDIGKDGDIQPGWWAIPRANCLRWAPLEPGKWKKFPSE